MAACMASAYVKFAGDLGVCLATSGTGASHLIIGLSDSARQVLASVMPGHKD